MKLLYTDVRTPLTQVLTQEAVRLVEDGKRVFYIAPDSLSFEKEAKVLSYLEGQASFAITVTRFAQMARYFILNQVFEEQPLDDIGLGMLFFSSVPDEGAGSQSLRGPAQGSSVYPATGPALS